MESIKSERVNQEAITVGDLLDKYEFKREKTVIHNGRIAKEEELSFALEQM